MQESISKKIQALLSKTVENGCTEEEASQAFSMAQKLMIKYNLDLSDVEKESIEYVKKYFNSKKKKTDHLTYLGPCVSRFTDTFGWCDVSADREILYNFFGASHDVDFALYLFTNVL